MTTPPITPSSSQIPDSFEHLIAGASACFLQSDADAIDSEIERAFAAYLRDEIEVRHRQQTTQNCHAARILEGQECT